MSDDIRGQTDLHREILRLLMDGWQTMDMGNQTGMFRLDDLSERFGLPPDRIRAEMALLEAFGYVDNVHSLGMDQTQAYTGVEQTAYIEHDPANPAWFITENGKRHVIANVAGDEGSAVSPA